jgi:riboflavin transporter FmnP
MKKPDVNRLVLSAMFIALGFALPFLTGQMQALGSMLSPMHIPVLLCGFVCGWPWGLIVGALTPLLRSLILGMPPLFPIAMAMAFEMAVYGTVAGLLYAKLPHKPLNVLVSLIAAMLAGRLVWGLAMYLLVGASGGSFGFQAFLAGAFLNAWPGIILHIVLIPPIVIALEKARFIPLKG